MNFNVGLRDAVLEYCKKHKIPYETVARVPKETDKQVQEEIDNFIRKVQEAHKGTQKSNLFFGNYVLERV